MSAARHPLFPLLSLVSKKCELATNCVVDVAACTGGVCSVQSFDEDLRAFAVQVVTVVVAAILRYLHGVSRHVSCIETVSRHGSFMSRSSLSLYICMSCLVSVPSFHVSSCLVSHDCVLTVSLSGIAMCLFCAETLTFLAERRSIYLLLTYLM